MRATSIHHVGRVVLLLGVVLALPGLVRAEELVLKNGQKVVGTIVGYEGDMFRVETEFGFALVRKDRVATINFGPDARKAPEAEATDRPGVAASPEAAAVHASGPAAASQPAISNRGHGTSVAAAARSQPSRPLDQPLPAKIQDRLEGNQYVNETFRFAMYKPPGWKIYEGAARETGRAIIAFGTEDERAILIVDREVWSGPPDLNSVAPEASLRRTYHAFRKQSESMAQVGGHSAVRREFTGLMDGAEWHGVSVHMARGNTLFGIIGLTSAEIYEFHQALFDKIINSFRFLAVK